MMASRSRIGVASLALLALSTLTACPATDPGAETLKAFRVDAPDTVVAGEAFDLAVVAIGSRGTAPFTEFDGTVDLGISAGTLDPASATLTSGSVTLDATVTGVVGDVVLTASSGAASGTASLTVEEPADLTRLPGDAADPASEAIPRLPFVARPQDYRDDAAGLEGVYVSFNTLALVLAQGVTVGDANTLLAEIGAIIVGGIPGVEGEAEGILFLRVPTADHQGMLDLLARLRADPLVERAVQDALLTTTLVPRPNGGSPAAWTWQTTPTGGNWGLERIRVPQLWNLNAAVAKRGRTTPTGVLDVGFADDHEDLVFDQNLTAGTQADHGTHVAGIVAATFDNGIGVDGVNPFAELVVSAPAFRGFGDVLDVRTSWGWQMSTGFFGLIDARRDVRVVNASLAYNWGPAAIDQNTSADVHALVENQGAIFAMAELIHVLYGHDLPMLVVAAGNDSNNISDGAGGTVPMEARWSSPYAYAGIELGMPNIIVVESVANSAADAGGATRSDFSDLGGDLSAPGSSVLSASWRFADPTDLYENRSGTSMAAPHVTGLIGYLLAVDPTLVHGEIVDLLEANAVAVAGGASPRIDAFATAMDVDRVQGGDTVLRMLLDVDDGTADGNQRLLAGSTVDYLEEDADGDGGVGDGRVDMSDFRRFRDWLLQVEFAAGLDLDGSASHPKKDVNGDGAVGSAGHENVYPRGDFNGDGSLSRTATRYVPGAVDADVTDLQVLQLRFDDPDYDVADLPGLLDSGDLEIWPRRCLDLPGVVRVESAILDGPATVETRSHTLASGARQVYTASLAGVDLGYTAMVRAYDASDAVVFERTAFFAFAPGSDASWDPLCAEHDVALLYAPDQDDAVGAYDEGLKGRGIHVTPVALGSPESADAALLGAFDLLLIDTYSGVMMVWSGGAKVVEAVVASGRPVVGLGAGGHAFFGQLMSPLGYPNGVPGDGLTGFAAVAPTHPSLLGPRSVAIDGGVVEVATEEMPYVSVYLSEPTAPLELVGRVGPTDYVDLIDGSGAGSALWGFHGVPSAYTDDGWNALANLMDYLIGAP